MIVTKSPDEPATVNDDVFEGTLDECQTGLLTCLSNVLSDCPDPKHSSTTASSINLYWTADDWVKLLVVPAIDIEIK
jgi:hypothetical protein